MTAYYNEKDPNAAAWIRDLIKEKCIAPGDVDERSIVDVRPSDLDGYTQCHFFAGIGGWSLALRLAGWHDNYPVWTGSCPCQPFSAAGKRKGFADNRHLWPDFKRLIAERRPAVVFGEQVARATAWLGLVRGDLEAMEYAVGAMPIEAASAGADHLRDRFWFVADDGSGRRDGSGWRESEQPRRAEVVGPGDQGGVMGDAGGTGLAVGPFSEIQLGDLRHEGPAVAPASVGGVDLAEPERDGAGRGPGCGPGQEAPAQRKHWRASGASFAPGVDGEAFEWVLGADGKARRVKPGVRLLAHALPRSMAALGAELEGLARVAGLHRQSLARAKGARVESLRGFGNAIDPWPAAKFIKAYRAIAA